MNVKKLLTFDLRSLALARFLLGGLCFIDIANRIPQIDTFYSDSGILPRWLLLQEFEWPWEMSLLNLNGSTTFAVIISLIGMIFAISYAMGLRTRLSNFIVWVVIMSFHARFQTINHGGDNLLRLMLFWSLFLPMNAYYSFDAVLSNHVRKETSYTGWGSAGWLVQTICVYLFTFFYKWDPSWFKTFDSVYYAMNLDMFTTQIGKSLLTHPVFMQFSSIFAFALEGLAPILLIIPWRMETWRGLAVALLFSLHIGIWLTLVLGNFPPGCLILWTAFIPSTFWSRFHKAERAGDGLKLFYDPDCGFCRKFCLLLQEFLILRSLEIQSGSKNEEVLALINVNKSWVLKIGEDTFFRFAVFRELLLHSGFVFFQFFGKALEIFPSFDLLYKKLSKRRRWWGMLVNQVGHEKIVLQDSYFKKTAMGFFVLLIFAWNIEGITESHYFRLDSPWNKIVFSLQLNQQWNMFAPRPMRDDGWWVAEGTLNDGKHWDILNNSFINFAKKKNVQDTYESTQWRKFLVNLHADNDHTILLWFGKFLCRRWNDTHAGGNVLNNYRLLFVRERTPPPGEPLPRPVIETVWNHQCFN